jgi:predicted porin
MKKSLLTLATSVTVASVAHAQSSVTLYGVIDEGINFNNNANGGRQYALASGVLMGSRWGIRGVEDLGGGLKAIFALENGFDVNSGKLGQGGLGFGRQAYVGLSSPFGAVTLGRQYDSVVDYVGQFGAGEQWGGYLTAHPADIDNFNNTERVNNAIKFTSVKYAGLSLGGLYSLGGVSGSFSRNQIWSLGGSYAQGPFSVGAAYLNIRNPNASFYGTGTVANATGGSLAGNNFIPTPVYSGYASATTQQVIAAGGAYTIGPATIGATYSNVKFMGLNGTVSPLNAAGLSGTVTFNNGELNFKYQLTPALLLGAAYDYTKASSIAGKSGAQYHQGAIGADYFLSARTDVYALGVYQKASGTDSTGRSAVAAINELTPSTTDHQVGIRFAIRHKF